MLALTADRKLQQCDQAGRIVEQGKFALMKVRDGLDERQAETGAFLAPAGVEASEAAARLIAALAWNARAPVSDAELQGRVFIVDHVALIEKNDWAELGRIVQVSGSRTYCLKGRLALLELQLMGWALKRIAEAGFTAITVPAIAREQAFLNQGQFPGHVEET